MPSRLRKCALGVVVSCILFSIAFGGITDQRRNLKINTLNRDPETVFLHLKQSDPVWFSKQIGEYHGEIIKWYENLNLVLVTIPSAPLTELMDKSEIEVLPHRQFEGCLAQSVEIIKPAAAWASLESQFGNTINGTGINVSVLDTGINDFHWDLDDFDENDATSDPKVLAEWDFVNSDANAMDDHGHGTHIASIIAGTGNRSSGLYTGVASGANLLNAKVLNNLNQGTESDIIDGIIWSVNNGAHVINLSLASSDSGNGTDALSLTVDWAVRQGVVVVVASGRTSGFYKVAKPGVSNLAITVGASNDADGITTLGGFGSTLDFRLKPELLAPGENIIAARAGITGDLTIGSPINDYYTEVDGTSQAAAHVSGVIALLLQLNPGWTPNDVKAALMGNAEEFSDDLYKRGAGRVDAVASANTSLLIDPLIDLQLFGGNIIHNSILTIRNIANENISCQFISGASINLTPDLITIPGKSSAVVNFSYVPPVWSDFHRESIIRAIYKGIEFRTVLCHVYPKCNTLISNSTIQYNGSLSVSGNLTLDEYVITDLVNLSLEVWAGEIQLTTLPVTTTDTTFNFTKLSSSGLYKGNHDLEVRLYQNKEIKFIKRSTLTVEGWIPTLIMYEFTGHRHLSVQLDWNLNNVNGDFQGNVSIYIQQNFVWVLIVANVSYPFEFQLEMSEGDYQIRIDFHGDPIHKSATSYTILHVLPPDLGPLAEIWPWLVLIGGVVGGAYLVNRHISRRQPKISPQKKRKMIRKNISEEFSVETEKKSSPIKSLTRVQITDASKEEPPVLKFKKRDYRIEAEPEVLDD